MQWQTGELQPSSKLTSDEAGELVKEWRKGAVESVLNRNTCRDAVMTQVSEIVKGKSSRRGRAFNIPSLRHAIVMGDRSSPVPAED